MARILIPSDDIDFVIRLAKAYERAGHEVVVGKLNFFVHGACFDFVHFLWPEEFSNWVPPTEATLTRIQEALGWWSTHTKILMTVNNLFPHGHEEDTRFRRLYEMFYRASGTVVHHSGASRDLVLKHFPVAAEKPHVIANQINYADLVHAGIDRKNVRAELGFNADETVIMVFGAIRLWAEVSLLMEMYRRLRLPGKRLLVVARYSELMPLGIWRKRFLRIRWQMWLKRIGARWVNEYVPDEDLHRYFEAADVVVVPRMKDMSSGLPGIGMTFGKIVVAPNHGAFPDYLAGTDNVLYESGNAESFAQAVAAAARLDREKVGRRNREIAATWTWDKLVQTCLAAVGITRVQRVSGDELATDKK